MTKLAEQLKQGADQAWESLAEGWRELSTRASGALTRLWPTPAAAATSPEPSAGAPDDNLPAFGGWAFMASDVVDDDDQVVVRIEAPGLQRDDFQIDLHGNTLVVRGEKRVDREVSRGRYSLLQCAYGSFHRSVALPVAVKADQARASYRNGVLRIALPKADEARARRIAVKAA